MKADIHNLSFEEFCKLCKLSHQQDESGKFFNNTHTQIAYQAFLYGIAFGANEVKKYLFDAGEIGRVERSKIDDVFIDNHLSVLKHTMNPHG